MTLWTDLVAVWCWQPGAEPETTKVPEFGRHVPPSPAAPVPSPPARPSTRPQGQAPATGAAAAPGVSCGP